VRTHKKATRARRARPVRRAYELILGGPDGRPRLEQFADARTYRARLASLRHAEIRSLSIDELATLLDS
jgi:hypothetical protein